MPQFTYLWEVSPESAHPGARKLLGDHSVVWDFQNGYSPFGGLVGSDTFDSFMKFRSEHPSGPIRRVLSEELDVPKIPDDGWDLVEPVDLKVVLGSPMTFIFLLRDDVVVALAFAQLVAEGTVVADILRLALFGVERQGTDAVISHREIDPEMGGDWNRAPAYYRSVLESV